MKLQVAIDLPTTKDALALLEKVAQFVDIIEIGTPLAKAEGLSVLKAVKSAYPEKEVFADYKTMDAGELEATMAFKAGADSVGVLALANDATITGAVKAGREHGKRVVADLIGVPPQARLTRIAELRQLGVEHVELHAGLDEQAAPGYSVSALLETIAGSPLPFAVAGGINTSTIGIVKAAGAAIAVVGGGIYGADDPEQAAKALRAAITG
ncbi:3-hexulose-6-phosphate synthase [Kozakia baliensis]|uniref:3-hexulose-6-phosphate synthase n=1 Tax=Kozakia baliensis TaxID=153496 RepID=A0A1D8UYG7_9PROT|nr:3-hexulose-6-phosphate synthase [Kozakia baliensis]AOX18680.1 3-hexulose-6-phosphate synthase [Kozakia baliensis]GBR33179.1 orotidine 5'-phosphate decarboxylase [Kozakia baliensis NRIC 0488]GEL65274.1 hypothetical protein KBA01_25600 [Kozakia baliensis]